MGTGTMALIAAGVTAVAGVGTTVYSVEQQKKAASKARDAQTELRHKQAEQLALKQREARKTGFSTDDTILSSVASGAQGKTLLGD